MKKVLFFIATAVLLFASCTQEKLDSATGQEVNVTFKAQIPENIATKVYSDGKSATVLTYAVYDSGSKAPLFSDNNVTVSNGVAVIDLTLITGKTYDLLFWAQSPANETYTVDLDAQTMTVNYGNMKANDESNDAFFAFETLTVGGSVNKTIELYRPFAQVNLGTNDLTASQDKSFILGETSMKATVANVLNFADKTVSGEALVEYAANAVPTTADGAFPVAGYDTYLSMNYLLVGEDQSTTSCEFAVYEKDKTIATNTITVSNIPVQRNYRTNIYGSLLTDPASIKVEIKPAFEEPKTDVVVDSEAFKSKVAEINANTKDTEFVIYLASDIVWETGAAGGGAEILFTNPDATVTIISDVKYATRSGGTTGKGHTITVTGQGGILSNAKVIFNDITFVDNTAYLAERGETAWEYCYLEFGYNQTGDFTFNRCVFENTIQVDSENATFVECIFKGKSTNEVNAANEYAVWVASTNSSFTECTFQDLYRGIKIHNGYSTAVQTMTIDECTFENISAKPAVAIDCVEGSAITIKNSAFSNVQPGDQGLYIYETDNVAPTLESNSMDCHCRRRDIR